MDKFWKIFLGSATECHVCCINGEKECVSIYANSTGDNRFLLRAVNAPCNYTFGLCDANGNCTRLLTHPALSKCEFPEHDGEQCGPRHFCINRQCRHICGDVSAECECKPGSPDECKVNFSKMFKKIFNTIFWEILGLLFVQRQMHFRFFGKTTDASKTGRNQLQFSKRNLWCKRKLHGHDFFLQQRHQWPAAMRSKKVQNFQIF